MNIMLGDDHVLFREGLKRLLDQLYGNTSYTEAATFDEVLTQCRGEEKFDLILSDLRMPGWPGFTGIDEIHRHQPGRPIVILSASENHSDVRNALDHGAAGYIPKSSSVKIMLSALELVFSGGMYVPPMLLRGGDDDEDDHRIEAARIGSPSMPAVHHMLTQRQWDVLNGLREGKSNKQIAYELGLSEGTVKIHVTAIFKSLRVRNRTQAAMAATSFGG